MFTDFLGKKLLFFGKSIFFQFLVDFWFVKKTRSHTAKSSIFFLQTQINQESKKNRLSEKKTFFSPRNRQKYEEKEKCLPIRHISDTQTARFFLSKNQKKSKKNAKKNKNTPVEKS